MLKCRAWAFVAPELWLLVQPLNSTTKALSSLDFGEGIELKQENKMELITKELRKQIPKLGVKKVEPMAYCKWFTPDSGWTWYVVEFDGEDICFGWVEGFEKELGYFSLKEIQIIRGILGLPVERDRYFTPCKLSELMKRS